MFVLAACGGKATDATTPGAKPSAAKAATPEPDPVCITPPDEAVAIRNAGADGAQVQYCLDEPTRSAKPASHCFAVDLDSGTYHRLVTRPERSTTHARVDAVIPKLDVCNGATCTSLAPKIMPGAAGMRAATNADGSFAVVLLGDAPKGTGYAEVWDVAKTKRTATFRYARGDFRCGEVALLDNTIYLSAAQCGQPAARAGLYTLKGRRIANVGGKDFGSFGGAYVHVDGATWAFLEENANKIVIQDVVKGKVWKTIDTSALFGASGSKMGTPGESVLVRLSDGRLAVIAGSPATGSVAAVDVGTGEVKVVQAPVCGS